MAIYNNPLSPSSINMYLECSYKFYLRYIKGLKFSSGEAAQFGTGIHKVNEMFWPAYRINSDPLIAMQDTINQYWDKTISAEYEAAAHDCMDNFLSILSENPITFPLYTEFKALNKDNNTVAIIDVVYPHKIVDYKTSKTFTVKPKEPNIIQAIMCSENLKHCLGLEVRTVEFQYLRYKKYQYIDVTPKLIHANNETILKIRKGIEEDIFPKSTKNCFFCDYALICKAEKRALEKLIKGNGDKICMKLEIL